MTEVMMDRTDYGPWSAWSPWTWLSAGLQESCRTRTVVHSWLSREVTYTDTWTCPSGYVYSGGRNGNCIPTQDRYPNIPGGGSAPSGSSQPATKSSKPTYGPWEPHEQKWTEKECRYETRFHRFGGKSEGNKKVRANVTLDRIADVRIPKGSKLAVRGSGSGRRDLLANGRPVNGRTVDTSDLSTGLAVIETTDEIDGVEQRYQLVTNVAAPLRFIVREPVAPLRGGKAEPTARLSASLENQSDSDQLVHLEVTAAPEDWQAEVVGDPIRLLAPKSRTNVRVRARRGPGAKSRRRRTELLAFGVRASQLGGQQVSEVTLYAR